MWTLNWSWNVVVPSWGRGDERSGLDRLGVARDHDAGGDGDDDDGGRGGGDDGGVDVAVELEQGLDRPL